MKTIPFTNRNIQYLGRFLSNPLYKQAAWQASQIRLKIRRTCTLLITTDISDISTSSPCSLVISIENSGLVTEYPLSSVEELFTGERSVAIPIDNREMEQLVTIKLVANSPLEQFGMSSYIRLKNLKIDKKGEILPYSQFGRLIMCIGDSWMSVEDDFPRFIDNQKYAIYPIAFNGAKADQIDVMYSYQAKGVEKRDPKVDGVIILLGVNDYVEGISKSAYKKSMLSLVNKIKEDQKATIFLIQAPKNKLESMNYDKYGGVLEEISDEMTNITYISTDKISNRLKWSDSYHLDNRSKKLFANYISIKMNEHFYD